VAIASAHRANGGLSGVGEIGLGHGPVSAVIVNRILVHADKRYDTDRIRRLIEAGGSVPSIPPKANRRCNNCFSPYLYRGRNAIERMFGRLKASPPATTASPRITCLQQSSAYRLWVPSLVSEILPHAQTSRRLLDRRQRQW
jgi:hypothetical protein